MNKLTICDLQVRRGSQQWCFVRVDAAEHRIAAEAAGIEPIGTAVDASTRSFAGSESVVVADAGQVGDRAGTAPGV